MRRILMIPGPVEYEPSVLSALSMPTRSHTDTDFIRIFGEALARTSSVFGLKDGFPFILSGSGTLGMETSVANFISRDDKVLVVSTGFFGERYQDLLSLYTSNVDVYRPPLGHSADPEVIREKVQRDNYSLVTVTHVDTSTGVRNDVRAIASSFRQSDTILAVDGVCSIGGEEFSMEWGVDVAFTASQKALGTPPGLTIGTVGPKGVEKMEKIKPLSFFSDLRRWKKVFESSLRSQPAYFGTPNVNLISALNVSLENILNEGIANRTRRHAVVANAFRKALSELGLKTLAGNDCANTLTVPYLPDNVGLRPFLSYAEKYGVVFAGGLLPEIKDRYFRIGHMGSVGQSEVMVSLAAIERSLAMNGYKVKFGSALGKAQEVFQENDFGFNSQ